MVHAALLLLMLEAVTTDLVSTISLKRSTQNIQLSPSCRPITPSFGGWSQLIDATLYLRGKDGVYADGSEILPRFLCGGENGAVGSVAAGRVAESDWAGFW